MPDAGVHPEAVQAQVARILGSRLFASSAALSDLLRFTVEKTLGGEAGQLKEYRIGTAVFRRPQSFDPADDSIVRVQARKLRKRLELYYATEGRQDPVRVVYVPGSYVPRFSEPAKVSAPKQAPPARIAVAVLPFLNLSPDLESAYFCDGLTEELIYVLSKKPALRVVARASSFQFKGIAQDVRIIGSKLGAQYLVDGAVRRSAGEVRVTVSLISVADGCQIWAERYDREMAGILEIQDEIARSIAAALSATVSAGPPAASPVRPVKDQAAYDLYLKGRYFWNQRTEEGFARAVQCYEQVILRDGEFARAYAGLAETYVLMMMHNLKAPAVVMPQARTAALAAVSIDPELASARSSLAAVRMLFDRDPEAAEKEWQHALQIDPDYATAWHWYAVFCLSPQGRDREALEAIQQAERLDPFSIPIANDAGFVLYFARRYEETVEQCRKTLSLNPHFYRAIYLTGLALAAEARYAEAVEHCLKARALMPGNAFLSQVLAALGFGYARMGQRDAALTTLGELQNLPFGSPVDVAVVQAALGAREEAFASLREAVAQRRGWVVFLPVDPLWDGLRDDVRLRQLLAELYPEPGR